MAVLTRTYPRTRTGTRAQHKQALLAEKIKEKTATCRLETVTSTFTSKTPIIVQPARSLSSLRRKLSYRLWRCRYRDQNFRGAALASPCFSSLGLRGERRYLKHVPPHHSSPRLPAPLEQAVTGKLKAQVYNQGAFKTTAGLLQHHPRC